MKLHGYPVEIFAEDDDTWAGTVPDLPGCVAAGDTPDELFAMLEDAIEGWLDAAQATGIAIPSPSREREYSGKLMVRMLPSLHRRLAKRARQEGVSLNLLIVSALSEAVASREVRTEPDVFAAWQPASWPTARLHPSLEPSQHRFVYGAQRFVLRGTVGSLLEQSLHGSLPGTEEPASVSDSTKLIELVAAR